MEKLGITFNKTENTICNRNAIFYSAVNRLNS